ncbi:diguanylate cyclase [Altererythrobacter salegens]|uniref:diguanylate cyclase n=1 Tax=Croceibacterium salegens TaxID=1737568 RepID=A0A6I4STR2_9SPHN|nr:GGDEF domain-containing protein [Croceibacterium salegens]MXO59243.1 diguanylate cyclase [Croceibacterium salegens]
MLVEPAQPSREELFAEGARVLAERERLSLLVNLPGIVFIAALSPFLSYGRFVLVAAALRAAAVALTRWRGKLARRAIERNQAVEAQVAGFARSLGFAGFTWALVLWPIARFGLSEPLGALLVVYVGVGVPLIVVMAAAMPRLLVSFGGCLLATLSAIIAIERTAAGTPLMLALMGLFVCVLLGGYGMHRQQAEVSRTMLENNKLADALAEANAELADALSHAEFLSQRDPLTGLLNRRAFFEEGCRSETLLCEGGQVLAIDLDHFKAINDRFGHAVGDRVLAAAADCMREIVHDQPGDDHCAVRLGGEEFALVLAGADRTAAIGAAESLRRLFATIPAEIGTADLSVSASIGVAALDPGQDVATALHNADEALYRAKHGGRDQVVQAAA